MLIYNQYLFNSIDYQFKKHVSPINTLDHLPTTMYHQITHPGSLTNKSGSRNNRNNPGSPHQANLTFIVYDWDGEQTDNFLGSAYFALSKVI